MKIVIPGGSGQVGTILARHFHQAGHEVVVLAEPLTLPVPNPQPGEASAGMAKA